MKKILLLTLAAITILVAGKLDESLGDFAEQKQAPAPNPIIEVKKTKLELFEENLIANDYECENLVKLEKLLKAKQKKFKKRSKERKYYKDAEDIVDEHILFCELEEMDISELKEFIEEEELNVKVTSKMSEDDIIERIEEALEDEEDEKNN